MSRVEMLCWAIIALQVVIICVGGFVADKVHDIWHVAMRAEHVPAYTDGETLLARARFQDSLNELDRTIDKTFRMPAPDYHDKPPGI